MEGVEGPPSATTPHSGPPSPPQDDHDFTPVGSPDHDHEIHALPSDEDHDHDHDDDQEHGQELDQGQDHSGGAGVLTDELKHKIIKQNCLEALSELKELAYVEGKLFPPLVASNAATNVLLGRKSLRHVEYYYSDENLQTDKYMLSFIKKNKEGFVPVAVIASFRKMKKLTRDYSLIAAALRESSFLVVSTNGRKIKRLHPLLSAEVRDPKLFTVLVENLPEDHTVENIRRIFGEAGNIKNICIRDPHAVEESTKGSKPDMLISSKLHALVEFETAEAAEKAVATLNDERDWRSGMRVKLLKRVVKYGQRRQVWRGPDSEKNSNSRGSDHTGDEENHNWSDHHDDTHDEEDGEHLSKDKNGHRGRNRGRARKHNYHGINGLGHGSASSTHAVEASKPPPGPRMPDGTRGFTMGRGRPPIANQS